MSLPGRNKESMLSLWNGTVGEVNLITSFCERKPTAGPWFSSCTVDIAIPAKSTVESACFSPHLSACVFHAPGDPIEIALGGEPSGVQQ